MDYRAKEQFLNELAGISKVNGPVGRVIAVRESEGSLSNFSSSENMLAAVDSFTNENIRSDNRIVPPSNLPGRADEGKHLQPARKPEIDMQAQEISNSQAFQNTSLQPDMANLRGFPVSNQMKPEAINWTGIVSHGDPSRGRVAPSSVQQESGGISSQTQGLDFNIQRNIDAHLSNYSIRDHWKPIATVDSENQPVKVHNLLLQHLPHSEIHI